ncbi:MAG: PilZ domain-containing protein [Deltaproteobacteria bacterium]|nr:PilZ domain-containing protein [Deltaproteobacteria bacterium]
MSRTYTSRTLRLISYLWMSYPASYLIYTLFPLALNLDGIIRVILSPGYWFVCFFAVIAGIGVLRIRWYGWYMFVFSNFLITYEVAYDLSHNSVGDMKTVCFFTTLGLQILVIYLIGREIRVPYFFPRIRWWESDPRYKLSVQTKLVREDKSELEGEIMDLSLGGCFIKTHSYFTPDETITLDFALFERPVRCAGHVVWRTESTVTHPKGIGVKFNTLNKETIFCLKQATQKLRKLARVYSQMSRERNWQEYLQREQRYQGKNKK